MSLPFAENPYANIQYAIQKIGFPLIISLGTIGSALGVGVFLQQTMRQNPCSNYLVAYNSANIVFIWLAMFPNYLSLGFGIDPGSYILPYCRFRFYAIFLLLILCPSYLILACIDRALMTSPKTNIRQKSTHRLAYYLIIGVTIGWCLFYSHAFVKVNIQEFFPGFALCIYDTGLYTTLMTWNSIVIDGILPPTLMTVFACMTLKNIRQVRVTPTTVTTNNNGRLIQKKDRQFIILVFSEIVVYTIFSSMQPVMLLYIELTKDTMKSFHQFYLDWLLASIGNFLVYLPSCINFYVNLSVSSPFRNQVKNMFLKLYSFILHKPLEHRNLLGNTQTRNTAVASRHY